MLSTLSPAKTGRRLDWWYRLTGPAEPVSTLYRKHYHRARTASRLILVLGLFDLGSLPAAIWGPNPFLLAILALAGGSLVVGTMFNRNGQVTATGLIIFGVAELCIALNITITILTSPSGGNVSIIPLFALFVIPLIIISSLFSTWASVLTVGGNSAFTIAAFLFLRQGGVALLTVPLAIQCVVAAAFLWKSSVVTAVESFEYEFARSNWWLGTTGTPSFKRHLATLATQLSNLQTMPTKDLPLLPGQENSLSTIIAPINALIVRLQLQHQVETEYTRLVLELTSLIDGLHEAHTSHHPLTVDRTCFRPGGLGEQLYQALLDQE